MKKNERRVRRVSATTLCAECYQPIDLPALWATHAAGKDFMHSCGRILKRPDA